MMLAGSTLAATMPPPAGTSAPTSASSRGRPNASERPARSKSAAVPASVRLHATPGYGSSGTGSAGLGWAADVSASSGLAGVSAFAESPGEGLGGGCGDGPGGQGGDRGGCGGWLGDGGETRGTPSELTS
eukprot:scaffold116656_cov36-Phaeocystis_antarctica.AAC.2